MIPTKANPFGRNTLYKKRLNYLESTGTQYIDTGIFGDGSTYFYIDFEYTHILEKSKYEVFGSSSGGGANSRMALGQDPQNPPNYFYFYFGIGNKNLYIQSDIGLNRHTMFFNCSDGTYGADNEIRSDTFNITRASLSMLLFARHNARTGTVIDGFCQCKLYRAIIKNSTDNFNFIPVLDNNNVPCMFDTVSQTFFYNQGSGDFLYN